MNSPRQGWSESRGDWRGGIRRTNYKSQSTAKCSGQELSLPQGIFIVTKLLQGPEAESAAPVLSTLWRGSLVPLSLYLGSMIRRVALPPRNRSLQGSTGSGEARGGPWAPGLHFEFSICCCFTGQICPIECEYIKKVFKRMKEMARDQRDITGSLALPRVGQRCACFYKSLARRNWLKYELTMGLVLIASNSNSGKNHLCWMLSHQRCSQKSVYIGSFSPKVFH